MTAQKKPTLAENYGRIGWALFLIALGVILIIPDSWMPDGIGRIALGALFLFFWVGGWIRQLEVNWFVLFIGIALVLSGSLEFVGLAISLFPLLLIAAGVLYLINILSTGKRAAKKE